MTLNKFTERERERERGKLKPSLVPPLSTSIYFNSFHFISQFSPETEQRKRKRVFSREKSSNELLAYLNFFFKFKLGCCTLGCKASDQFAILVSPTLDFISRAGKYQIYSRNNLVGCWRSMDEEEEEGGAGGGEVIGRDFVIE